MPGDVGTLHMALGSPVHDARINQCASAIVEQAAVQPKVVLVRKRRENSRRDRADPCLYAVAVVDQRRDMRPDGARDVVRFGPAPTSSARWHWSLGSRWTASSMGGAPAGRRQGRVQFGKPRSSRHQGPLCGSRRSARRGKTPAVSPGALDERHVDAARHVVVDVTHVHGQVLHATTLMALAQVARQEKTPPCASRHRATKSRTGSCPGMRTGEKSPPSAVAGSRSQAWLSPLDQGPRFVAAARHPNAHAGTQQPADFDRVDGLHVSARVG